MSSYIDRRGDHMNERESYLEDRIEVLRGQIKKLEQAESDFIAHIARFTPVDIATANDDQIEQAVVALNWIINKAQRWGMPQPTGGCSLNLESKPIASLGRRDQ